MKITTPSTRRGRLSDGAPNPIDQHIGQRCRIRRTLLGMSQEKLGEHLGLTFQQVQKYERGANRIGASRLFDMAQALGVPVGYFFEEMADKVKAASPASIHAGFNVTAVIGVEADPMLKRESLELMRGYHAIRDPEVRRAIYELVKVSAGARPAPMRAVG